jgi:hypothetical protein
MARTILLVDRVVGKVLKKKHLSQIIGLSNFISNTFGSEKI